MERVLNLPVFISPKTIIHYPESDGTPMGETGFHVNVMLYLKQALELYFQQQKDIYVAANMFFYYEEGNPSAVAAPDVFVVKGVSKAERRTYKLWEEEKVPCAIFEITSRSTQREDLGNKRALYERLNVKEYFIFDPLEEYLSPCLQGFRLHRGYYHPIPLSDDGSLSSRELDLILKPAGTLLRLIDPHSQEMLPTLGEAAQRANQAEAKAARLQAELAELRAQLKRR